jgi:hypothetical protein
VAGSTGDSGLVALLSHAFVAFTIEVDNAYEASVLHRTTRAGGSKGAWLTSAAMWWTCLRYVDENGVSVGELFRLARTPTNLHGMQRWGYVTVGPDPPARAVKQPKSGWLVRATTRGVRARAVWPPLFGEIEERWRTRHGARPIAELRDALGRLIAHFGVALPDCMPILGYGLFNPRKGDESPAMRASTEGNDRDGSLVALLAKVLLGFALDYERDAPLSLAVAVDVLSVIEPDGTNVADLPVRTGVSKEGIAMALTFLKNEGYVTVGQSSPSARLRAVVLSEKGRAARRAHGVRLAQIEARWRERFGAETVDRVLHALSAIAGDAAPSQALLAGMRPPSSGWRAALPPITVLPGFPMVLHRGGFPDGA